MATKSCNHPKKTKEQPTKNIPPMAPEKKEERNSTPDRAEKAKNKRKRKERFPSCQKEEKGALLLVGWSTPVAGRGKGGGGKVLEGWGGGRGKGGAVGC